MLVIEMNKEITIYELLGLVKDGKQPRRIKYYDRIYIYDNYKGDSGYVDKTVEPYKWFVKECDIERDLNDTVEIIEDNDKLEKIEKEELFSLDESMTKSSLVAWQKANNGMFKKQIDFLIDHINKIEERLDER
jgi:hypothetical protein